MGSWAEYEVAEFGVVMVAKMGGIGDDGWQMFTDAALGAALGGLAMAAARVRG